MLLNHALTIAYENKDIDTFKNLINDFSQHTTTFGNNLAVLPFGHPVLSEKCWDISHKIIVSSFNEKVTLVPPSQGTFQESQKLIDK